MKVLMISPYIPWPLYGGSSVRIFNLLEEFSNRGHKITLLAGSENTELAKDNPLNAICDKIHPYRMPRGSSFLFAFWSLFSFQPYPVLKFQTASLRRNLRSIIGSQKFDLIWVNLSILVDALPSDLIKDTPILLDHAECEEWVYEDYIREGNLAEKVFSFINLLKLKKFKKRVFSAVDAILCVSEQEANFTRSQTKVDVWVAPNGVNNDFSYKDNFLEDRPNRIIFCGNMGVRRNIDAAVWFAERIFPQVKKQVSDAEFWIVGSEPSSKILGLKSVQGIRVTGTVKDIKEYYTNGKVFVAPYHFGAGTRLKVLEAMASGIPIVSTTVGCRGIKMVDGKHFLVADSEADFSRCVTTLLLNPKLAESLAKNTLKLIEEEYRWGKIVNDLEQKISKLLQNL